MKKLFILTVASMLLFILGCKDDPTPELVVGLENIQIPYNGDIVTIPVSCNMTSKATVSYEDPDNTGWIFILPSVLNGNGNIEVRVQPNSDIWNDRTATVTVTAGELSKTVQVEQSRVDVFHPEDGIEINGLLWAKCDVGEPGSFTASPDVRGLLYQYDSKIGYPNSSPNVSDAPEGYKTGQFPLGDTWVPENSPCPPGWRIPTAEEIEALIGNNTNKKFAWVTPEQSGFAIPGAIVGIPATEAALATKDNMRGGIFIPQSGFRNRDDGKQTVWWPANITSITRPGQNWDRITFWIDGSNNMGRNDYTGNAAAYPVRCVADINK
ncbi:MAG: BACON domain-containing protein [Mangrovibacterium sp.]